jgi:aldehyde dehydrogenase (NAD+)
VTARRIQAAAADSLTPLVLELGGKSANLVFPDADLDRASAFATIITKLSGQGCSLPSRLLVHEDVHDRVVERVVEHFGQLVLGDPLDDATDMGPVINEAACERILAMVDRSVDDGATVACGGRRRDGSLADGYFVEPTVLLGVEPTCEIGQEEVFGPVLSVMTFRDEDEAVALANGTRFGLAAYAHTRDVARTMRLARRLEAGSVAFNGAAIPAGHASPFGGINESGYGRQGGREGIGEFLRTKNVLIPDV